MTEIAPDHTVACFRFGGEEQGERGRGMSERKTQGKELLIAKGLKQYFPSGRIALSVPLTAWISPSTRVRLWVWSESPVPVRVPSPIRLWACIGRRMERSFSTGNSITGDTKGRTKDFRRDAQIVFQDPGSSLNPYQDVRQIFSLPLKVHNVVPKSDIDDTIREILEMVELPPDFMYKSPNSIGGGERQLVSIARALCSDPKFIILDEPTSSLDVSIQAKILNMLMKLHEEKKLTYMFITHDMGVMRNVSTKIAIMYLGKICEIAPTKTFYEEPLHPYTQMLLSAIPVISRRRKR